jgi:hypothetical protein
MGLKYSLLKTLGILSLAGGIYAGSQFIENTNYLERNKSRFEFKREGNYTIVPYEKFKVEKDRKNNGLLALLGLGVAFTFTKGFIEISSDPEFKIKEAIKQYGKNLYNEEKFNRELKSTEKRIEEGAKILENKIRDLDSNSLRKIDEIYIYESKGSYFGIDKGKKLNVKVKTK